MQKINKNKWEQITSTKDKKALALKLIPAITALALLIFLSVVLEENSELKTAKSLLELEKNQQETKLNLLEENMAKSLQSEETLKNEFEAKLVQCQASTKKKKRQ